MYSDTVHYFLIQLHTSKNLTFLDAIKCQFLARKSWQKKPPCKDPKDDLGMY